MQFISNKQDLSQMIYIVQRAISTKSPMPILTGIKIEAYDGLLTVTATDLEMGIKYCMPAQVLEEGAAVLPSKHTADLIRLLPDLPIVFKEDNDNSMTIRYGESETSVNCFPNEEYPEMEFPEQGKGFTIKESDFESALRQILFAVATDDNRAASLTGAMLSVEKESLEMVSTDLHRLSWRRLPIENSDDEENILIIPGKALTELSKIIGKNDEEIKVNINENMVLFNLSNISFMTRLMNGKFPKYKQVIPQKFKTRIRVKTKEMLEAAERASLLNIEEKSSIKLVIGEGRMIISDTTSLGRIYEEIPVDLTGEEATIGFNAYYLIDLLKTIKREETEIDLDGPFSPGVFKPIGEKDCFSLILPVRM